MTTKKEYQRRLDVGVCVICGKAVADDKHVTCEECRKKRLKQQKNRRRGICTKCGKNPRKEGGRYCQECLDKAKEYAMRRKTNMAEKSTYIEGECQRCSLPAVRDGLCERHLRLKEKRGA